MKGNQYFLLVVFLILTDLNICISQWSTDPKENTRVNRWGLNPKITTDGAGGAIISWEDDYAWGRDIVAQHVDSSGYKRWAEEGVVICNAELDQFMWSGDIVSDSSGGAYIAWTDHRRSVKPGYLMDSSDVYMQLIDFNGQVLWQENGIRISNGINYAFQARMASDYSGGVVIAWISQYSYDYPVDIAINLQRISSTGEFLWSEDSAKIFAPNFNQDPSMAIINDGNNGLIVTCSEGIFRFDLNGEITWHVADIPGRMTDYSIVSDEDGGGILWYTNNVNFNYDLYIQRVNSEGKLIWVENGVFVTTKIPRYWGTSLASDGEHGAYISWIDSSYTYHYNRIDSCGNLLWDDDSLFFGQLNGKQNLLSTEKEEVIVVYRESNTSTAGKVQKLGRKGIKIWVEEGVLFSNLVMANSSCNKISDGDNGIIIVWYERDWEPHYGIFAQRINKYGQLGMITTVKHPIEMQLPTEYGLSQNWPNPFNNQTIIQYKLPQKGKVRLTIFNVHGKEVITLINKEQSKGSYHVIWNGKDNEGGDAATGIYFYQLKMNELVKTKELILIR